MLDEMDVKILKILQQDCTRSVAEVGKEVGLSTTPCWRRIQKLEEAGVIQRRVAILAAPLVNVGVTVFVSIKTDSHSLAWLERFHAAVIDFPEVVEFYRMSGEVDYLLRVVVPDIAAYDAFYKKLISPHRDLQGVVGLRHGADQVHDRAAARFRARGQPSGRATRSRAPAPRAPRAGWLAIDDASTSGTTPEDEDLHVMSASKPGVGVAPLETLKSMHGLDFLQGDRRGPSAGAAHHRHAGVHSRRGGARPCRLHGHP